MILFQLICLLSWIVQLSSAVQHTDCLQECDKFGDTLIEQFDRCMKECQAKKTTSVYPAPPANVTFRTIVEIEEYSKILETTITWLAPSDSKRTGFSLQLKAIDGHCQEEFPGYFTSNIGPKDRSHLIPLFNENDMILAFQHGCTYSLEMTSKPYPFADPEYTFKKLFTVPDCIGQYCKCEEGSVPSPTELVAREEADGIQVQWKQHRATRGLKFHLTIYKQFHSAFLKHKIQWEIISEHAIDNEINADGTAFSSSLPGLNLTRNEQFKISLFARDQQFCTSSDVESFFNTSATFATPLPTEVANSNVTFVTATVVEYPRPSSPSLVKIISEVDYRLFLLLAAVLLSVLVMFAVCFLCVYFWKKQKKKRDLAKLVQYPPSWSMAHSRRHSILENNVLYRHTTPKIYPRCESDWKINSNDVVVGGVIGEGAFGLVCLGTLKGPRGVPVRVAIKQLKANAIDEEKIEFKRELDIMKQVGSHPNIVCMYGIIDEGELQCMVMEFVPYGDLKHYLQNLRKQLTVAVSTLKSSLRLEDGTTFQDNAELQYTLDPTELQSFAAQVALGMAHLEQLSITHRDLAARNILVAENKQLKISDFGMSRPGVYVKISKGVIPLRWLSPEAIKDNVYSTKSDVWAYGIVLWEIVTLGGFPYSTITDKDLLNWLEEGNRLEKPLSCTDEMYDVMLKCWRFDPQARPSFTCICDCLGGLDTPYVDFDPLTPLPPPDAFDLIDTATLVTSNQS